MTPVCGAGASGTGAVPCRYADGEKETEVAMWYQWDVQARNMVRIPSAKTDKA